MFSFLEWILTILIVGTISALLNDTAEDLKDMYLFTLLAITLLKVIQIKNNEGTA